MRKISTKLALGVVMLLCSCVTAFAQKPQRIDFAKEGSNSLVWEEKVNANSSKVFVFYAKKGQKLRLGFIDDTKQGSMDWGKVSIEPNTEPMETIIEVTKDYRLSVSNNSNVTTSFRISISLEDPKKSARARSRNGKVESVTPH